jgi:hypothetical protein
VADGPLGTVLGILAVTAVGAVVVGVVLYAGTLSGAGIRLGRRLHLVRQPPPTPVGMPLERIARDLRRLRLQTVHEAGSPEARHRAVLMAYDGALADACRALGIETDLLELADGMEREAERFRVEVELERAGVQLHRA